MRLIDADELKQYMRGIETIMNSIGVTGLNCKLVTNSFMKGIDQQPTVDAVPVVRCKDCACSTNPACDCYGRGLTDPEWYCPDGVRADS